MWKLRAIFFTAPLIVGATVVMSTLSLITSLFDRTGNTQHRMARAWSRFLLWTGAVTVEAEGLEKIHAEGSYVLVSNHASYFDTPVILASIPLQFRFFAKQELFHIPFLGSHLQRAGHFPVARGDPRASLKSMADGARQIREKRISVLVFPEGGRSEKSLREFKEGAVHIAIKAGVPIVPVALVGTRNVLPMHSWLVHPGHVRLVVGDPIATADLTPRDRGPVNQRVLEAIAAITGEPVPVPV